MPLQCKQHCCKSYGSHKVTKLRYILIRLKHTNEYRTLLFINKVTNPIQLVEIQVCFIDQISNIGLEIYSFYLDAQCNAE